MTTYRYDSRNNLIGVTLPDPDGAGSLTSPTLSYAYNLAGEMTGETDALTRTTTRPVRTASGNPADARSRWDAGRAPARSCPARSTGATVGLMAALSRVPGAALPSEWTIGGGWRARGAAGLAAARPPPARRTS